MAKKSYTDTVNEINAAIWLITEKLGRIEKKVDAIELGTISTAQHEMYAESLKAMATAMESLSIGRQ